MRIKNGRNRKACILRIEERGSKKNHAGMVSDMEAMGKGKRRENRNGKRKETEKERKIKKESENGRFDMLREVCMIFCLIA